MALIPMRRNPLTSLLSFAAERDREAMSLGDVISQIAKPVLGGMGVKTDEPTPQPAVMRGPVPQVQPLGPMTGPAMAPTPVDFNPRSTELLSAADPRLREVLTETEKRARERGIEIQVSETVRDRERQADLVAQGKSQTMNSKHLTGNAADIFIQNPDGSANWDFEAYRPVADIAKEVAAEMGYDDLVWGGDWQTLKDGVHFQMGGAAVTGGGNAPSMFGGQGTDTLATPESIFAGLYDAEQAAADEKKAKRKDFFAAVSQGLSALSQGRPIDFSNIAANAQERRKAAAAEAKDADMRRIAATYMLNRYNDPEAARAIATGALGINDILSMREQDQLYTQRAAQIEATEAGQNAIKKLVLDRGGSQEEADAAAAAPDFYLNLDERQTAADKADVERIQKEEELAGMNVTAQRWLQSDDPGKVSAAEEFLALPNDTARSGYDLFARAKDYAPAGEAAAPTAIQLWNDAKARLVDSGDMSADAFYAEYGRTPAAYESSNAARQGGAEIDQYGISGTQTLPVDPANSPSTSVFNVAPSSTGVGAAIAETAAGTLGQASEALGFGPIGQETVAAKQRFTAWRANAINALKTNARVLAQELNLIQTELAPESSAFQSPETLRTKLVEIDGALRRRLESELARANDPNIPVKDREDARRIADDLNYTLQTLHEPAPEAPAQAAPAEAAPAPVAEVGETVELNDFAGVVVINEDGSERVLKAGEQPKVGDTVRLPDGTLGVIE